MQKVLIIALIALTIGLYSQLGETSEFQKWKQQHLKSYSPVEEQYRLKIFEENLQTILKHNSGNHGWKMGLNQFADLTDEEFQQIYLMKGVQVEKKQIKNSNIQYPLSADWETTLNPIKNQGACGSCWTFSATGALEAYLIIRQSVKLVVSEQQVLDCALDAGDGCNGGGADDAIDFLNRNGGVTESQYPYKAVQGTCQYPRGKIFGNMRENFDMNESAMKQAISEYPISVSVDATNWKFYASGVFKGSCRDDFHNHAVVAVGYDAAGNWKIRNSWGPGYGENGHIWLAPGNSCAVMTRVDRVA
ncbi:hypothetical protein pb186bvf_005639 [Paramecium bursaria]